MAEKKPETDPLVQYISELYKSIHAQVEEQTAIARDAHLQTISTLQPVRAELPQVIRTPDGRVDFTYILGRLVTAGACSLSEIGGVPFSRVVQLFEYWKTYPPEHETLVKIRETLDWISEHNQNLHLGSEAPDPACVLDQPELADEVNERSIRRKAKVMPILGQKRWKPGKWATEAGVGKNSIYQYLDGKRKTITKANRQPMAEVLGLEPSELPD